MITINTSLKLSCSCFSKGSDLIVETGCGETYIHILTYKIKNVIRMDLFVNKPILMLTQEIHGGCGGCRLANVYL